MALCINQSGTWRNTTTLCVNQSGTWRLVQVGQINQSGTWRTYRDCRPPGCCPYTNSCALGSNIEGGFLICKSSNVAWIVAPNTSEVVRGWYARDDANIRAQEVSGCTGWFVPTISQLTNPGYTCRTYWDSYTNYIYWSSTEVSAGSACFYAFNFGGAFTESKGRPDAVRAFRCVTYNV